MAKQKTGDGGLVRYILLCESSVALVWGPSGGPSDLSPMGPSRDIVQPWFLVFGIATLLLVLGSTSGLVNSGLWVSEPLVCAAFGVVIGPICLGMLHLDRPAFVFGVLLLHRIPAWLLLRRFMPWARRLPENLFVGWFGPVGATAMFYAPEAQDMTGLAMLWPIVSLAAAASVLAHGVSGTSFTALLGERLRERMATP